jgi:pilus assembly protein CpaE
MTSMRANETSRGWRQYDRVPAVGLYLSDRDGNAGALVGQRAAGFPLSVQPCDPLDEIDPASLNGLAAAIIEVAAGVPESIKRFETLASRSTTPVFAAVYEAPLALVRTLMRAGAHDVLPLPIDLAEIEASLAPLREKLSAAIASHAPHGKIVAVIKSSGGAGATSLLGQLAIRHAERVAETGRQACLIDLDVQFGDAAFQLGLRPSLSLGDLIDAGKRLDADLFQSTVTEHPSGLKVIAAPADMVPLESLSNDQVIDIVDLATRQFDMVFVDLPSNWAHWSLSVLARSDLVLLVTEISIPALRQARRQLDLIRSQDLGTVEIRIVANRCQSGLLRKFRPADIHAALGRDIAHTIADDPDVIRAAVDQGIPISEIKRKSAIGRDLDMLDKGISAALGLDI